MLEYYQRNVGATLFAVHHFGPLPCPVTFPIQDYYRTVGIDFTHESFEHLSKEFTSSYESRRHECALHPHTRCLLENATALGKSQSLLSAYPQQTLDELVRAFRLTGFFERVLGVDNIYGRSKVTEGQELLLSLRYSSSDVLLVGDTLHDAEVAEAIGTECVLVAHGHQSKDRLQQSGVPVVDSLEALYKFI